MRKNKISKKKSPQKIHNISTSWLDSLWIKNSLLARSQTPEVASRGWQNGHAQCTYTGSRLSISAIFLRMEDTTSPVSAPPSGRYLSSICRWRSIRSWASLNCSLMRMKEEGWYKRSLGAIFASKRYCGPSKGKDTKTDHGVKDNVKKGEMKGRTEHRQIAV